MGNWYDNLSDEQIQQLKDNEYPFGLYGNGWMRDVFEAMPYADREYFGEYRWKSDGSDMFMEVWVYRLRRDWQRPKPEMVGRWEYLEVDVINNRNWLVRHLYSTRALSETMGMIGFGGIEFKEWPGVWYMHPMLDIEAGIPATPVRVRMWVEG